MADGIFTAGNTPASSFRKGGRPSGNPSATARAQALTDIAREIRAWGSVGLFGAAERLEALAQEGAAEALAASVPARADSELPLMIEGERKALLLEAAWQIDALVDTVLGLVEPSTKGIAITSIAARIRDLSDATLALVDDPKDSLVRLHRKVHGAFPEGEGEVS